MHELLGCSMQNSRIQVAASSSTEQRQNNSAVL
eukprot:COSAG01_NODE_44843_length_415_cov_0.655063_1_plen_32_part_01